MPFNLQQALTDRGANFQEGPPRGDHVVIDDQLITGQNPWSSATLAGALVDAVERGSADRLWSNLPVRSRGIGSGPSNKRRKLG